MRMLQARAAALHTDVEFDVVAYTDLNPDVQVGVHRLLSRCTPSYTDFEPDVVASPTLYLQPDVVAPNTCTKEEWPGAALP